MKDIKQILNKLQCLIFGHEWLTFMKQHAVVGDDVKIITTAKCVYCKKLKTSEEEWVK